MEKDRDEYNEIYKLDMQKEWTESAYDENGDSVFCDICGEELKWNPVTGGWICRGCGQEMTRCAYFDYIGAETPGSECLTSCRENYPFCKKTCERYFFDPMDPMLT